MARESFTRSICIVASGVFAALASAALASFHGSGALAYLFGMPMAFAAGAATAFMVLELVAKFWRPSVGLILALPRVALASVELLGVAASRFKAWCSRALMHLGYVGGGFLLGQDDRVPS